jgi:hypothetical protein
MCLTVMSHRFVRVSFVGEYVFVTERRGAIQTREVYDVFFRVSRNWAGARLLCLSPHRLIGDDGILHVSAVATPGAGGPDDIVYHAGIATDATYDPDTCVMNISVLAQETNDPVETFKGTVIVPEIGLPGTLANNPQLAGIRVFMAEAGTLFEVRFKGDLQGGKDYMFRLVLDPVGLLGLPKRQVHQSPGLVETHGVWEQDATIYCPRTCRRNFEHFLELARDLPANAAAGAGIETAMVAGTQPPLRPLTVLPGLHRIAMALPVQSTIERESAPGAIYMVGTYALPNPDGRPFVEWLGGTRNCRCDDVEKLSRDIFCYLRDWAKSEPKRKEDVSTALNAPHDLCSQLIGCLQAAGIVHEPRSGYYQACDGVSPDKLADACEGIALNRASNCRLPWRGYEIKFCLIYRSLSTWWGCYLAWWYAHRATVALTIGALGLLLGIINLLIKLCRWIP